MACAVAAVAFIDAAVIGGVTWWLGLSESTTDTNAAGAAFSHHINQALSIKRIASIPENIPSVGLHITPFIAPATPTAPSISRVPGEPTCSTAILPWIEHVHSSTWQWGLEILVKILISIALIFLCSAASDCIDHFCTFCATKLRWPFSWTTTHQKQLEQEVKDLRAANVTLKDDNQKQSKEIARLEGKLDKAAEASEGHLKQLDHAKKRSWRAQRGQHHYSKDAPGGTQSLKREPCNHEGDAWRGDCQGRETRKASKKVPDVSTKKLQKAEKEAEDALKASAKKQEQLDAANARIEELNTQLKDLRVKKDWADSELDGARTHIERLENHEVELKAQNSWLEMDIEQLKNICLTLQRNIKNKKSAAVLAKAEAETCLEVEQDRNEQLDVKVDVLRTMLRAQIDQAKHLSFDNDDLTWNLTRLRSSIEQQAQLIAQDILNGLWNDMVAWENNMSARVQHLEVENADLNHQTDFFRSQLCKRCLCKRPDGSNGSEDDENDDNDDSGHRHDENDEYDDYEDHGPRDPDLFDDSGPVTGITVRLPQSSNQHDGSTPNIAYIINGPEGPPENSSPSKDNGTSFLQQVKDSIAGLTARNPRPDCEDDAPPFNDVDSSNSQASAASSFSPHCPLGSAHTNCTFMFIPGPDFATLSATSQRLHQRTFARRRRRRVKCAYTVYAELHPDAPIPTASQIHWREQRGVEELDGAV